MALTESYDGSIMAILEDIRTTAGLEGLAIVDLAPGPRDEPLLYNVGVPHPATIANGKLLLTGQPGRPTHLVGADKRPLLACPWTMPPSRPGGLLMWRPPQASPWMATDHGLAATVAMLLRGALGSAAGPIGIDRMTGLPNRRWFLQEVARRADRIDHQAGVASLLLVDIDDLHRINAHLGREQGDRILVRLAGLLRSVVRAGDLVARVGADEFAIWLDNMDHLTAAERADALCSGNLQHRDHPGHAGHMSRPDWARPDLDTPRFGLSIGIVSHRTGHEVDIRALLRQAYMAARDVKSRGGGGWRVSHPAPLPGALDRPG